MSGKKDKQARKAEALKRGEIVQYGEEIELLNGHFDNFLEGVLSQGSISLRKLRREQFSKELRKAFFQLWIQISDSKQAKTFIEMRNQIIQEFNTEQDKLPKEQQLQNPRYQDIKGLQELLDEPSGLKINKLKIPMDILSNSVVTEDLIATAWLIEYT